MTKKITLIPGNGIGPEITDAMTKCVEATGVSIEWDRQEAGSDVMDKHGTPLPESVLGSIRQNKVAIKGPIVTPVGTGFRSVNVALRKELDLYVCLRPCKIYPGVNTRYKEVDLILIRENTEDLYAGIEFEKGRDETAELISFIEKKKNRKVTDDSAISIKPISYKASKRIIKFAFDFAVKNNRKKVTAVHKANIIKYTDGLFLDVAREVAKEYEGKIEFNDRIVDNMCMQLVQRPEMYDVLVLPNLYGDIISDLCAGLIGGLGVAPGANIGDDIALFEPTHGSAPKYKGLNKVNPVALILSSVLMLRHIGNVREAERLENAVAEVMREGKAVTYDMHPERYAPVGTSQMADAIVERIKG